MCAFLLWVLDASNVQAFQEEIGWVVLQVAYPACHQAGGMACAQEVSRLHQAGERRMASLVVLLAYRPAVEMACGAAYRQGPEACRP
jgi:hypothetical protein